MHACIHSHRTWYIKIYLFCVFTSKSYYMYVSGHFLESKFETSIMVGTTFFASMNIHKSSAITPYLGLQFTTSCKEGKQSKHPVKRKTE